MDGDGLKRDQFFAKTARVFPGRPLRINLHNQTEEFNKASIEQASPYDDSSICDPICADDIKLAVATTLGCWLLLGVLPVIVGIFGIHFARKAKSCKNEKEKEYYSSLSRSISWIGMLSFTFLMTLSIFVLALFGISK